VPPKISVETDYESVIVMHTDYIDHDGFPLDYPTNNTKVYCYGIVDNKVVSVEIPLKKHYEVLAVNTISTAHVSTFYLD